MFYVCAMKALQLTVHCATMTNRWPWFLHSSAVLHHTGFYKMFLEILTVWDCFVLKQQAHSQCLFEWYMSQHAPLEKPHLCKWYKTSVERKQMGSKVKKKKQREVLLFPFFSYLFLHLYFFFLASGAECNRHFLCRPSRFKMTFLPWHMSCGHRTVMNKCNRCNICVPGGQPEKNVDQISQQDL